MSKPKYQRLKRKISRITIGYTRHHKPITVSDLKVEGALTLILKDAIKPNLVQTIEELQLLFTEALLPILLMVVTLY